jgi:hypothetical protein
MAMWKVVIQKIVVNKPKPKEADRMMRRRVVVVDAKSAALAEKKVRASVDMMGPDHTGEIVEVRGPLLYAVLSA